MRLIFYYVACMIAGDFVAYFIGLFVEYKWGSYPSLLVFLAPRIRLYSIMPHASGKPLLVVLRGMLSDKCALDATQEVKTASQ